MKRRNPLRSRIVPVLFGFCFIFMQACNDDDCGDDYICSAPPRLFGFVIVDKTSGENLFTNGTYQPSQIEIIDMGDSSNVEFSFVDENDRDIILISSLEMKTGDTQFSVKIADVSVFNFFVNVDRLTEDCCSIIRINEARIENAEYELVCEVALDCAADRYKIFVE